MENNIHNDGLEDFLRKSFEQYDDSPSDGLWDKIDADLTQQPKVLPIGGGPGQLRWWLAAAAFLLLLVGQSIYFHHEKKSLTEIIHQQAEKIETLERELARKAPANTDPSTTIPDNSDNTSEDRSTHTAKVPAQVPLSETGNRYQAAAEVKKELPNNEAAVSPPINTQLENRQVSGYAEEPPAVTAAQSFTDNSTNHRPNQQRSSSEVPGTLESIGLFSLQPPATKIALPVTGINPAPTQNQGRFSIGAHHTLLATSERMARVIRRPMAPNNRVFNNTRAMTGTTRLTGVSAQYQNKNNWLLESGLSYRQTSLSTEHRALLRFMDRRNNGNNAPFDFEYALNTPSGSVDITVRADQTDPTETINEFENIAIAVNMEQTFDYLSIPLSAGYQFGQGRLRAQLTSGLLFNFLTRHSIDISGTIINSNLQSRQITHHRSSGNGSKNTTIDFLSAIGMSYQLNHNLRAQISPTMLIPLSDRHNDPYIKTTGFSAGVDVGLYLNF